MTGLAIEHLLLLSLMLEQLLVLLLLLGRLARLRMISFGEKTHLGLGLAPSHEVL